MTLRALIFDLDGVVIDSHDAHHQSWSDLAAELGHEFTDSQFKASFGQRNETIIPWLGWADSSNPDDIRRLGDRKEDLYRASLRRDGIVPLPGVVDLLNTLLAADIPAALGTSTPLANVECVLELTGLASCFRFIAASEDVSHGKPDPEVFLCAAAGLSTDPARCVVIEDAKAGIQAAKAGGMKAVAVTTTHSRASLAAETPDLIVDSLTEIQIPALEDLFE